MQYGSPAASRLCTRRRMCDGVERSSIVTGRPEGLRKGNRPEDLRERARVGKDLGCQPRRAQCGIWGRGGGRESRPIWRAIQQAEGRRRTYAPRSLLPRRCMDTAMSQYVGWHPREASDGDSTSGSWANPIVLIERRGGNYKPERWQREQRGRATSEEAATQVRCGSGGGPARSWRTARRWMPCRHARHGWRAPRRRDRARSARPAPLWIPSSPARARLGPRCRE